MYSPDHFEEIDPEILEQLITDYNFGTLISVVGGRPFATHLPFLLDVEAHCLIAHMARANEHWQALAADSMDALVIFQGPHTYVSPTWYADPGVPTWNYAAVHVYGEFTLIDDPDAHKAAMIALTERHENDHAHAWRADFAQSPAKGMLAGTVAFRIAIKEIQGKFKLSQNRSAIDRERVIAKLETSDDSNAQAIAALMQARQ